LGGHHEGSCPRPLPEPKANQDRHHHPRHIIGGQREAIATKVWEGVVRADQEVHRKDQLKQSLGGRYSEKGLGRSLDRGKVLGSQTHDAGIGSAWPTAATLASKVTR